MKKLNILWTTVNKDTIKNMIAMYSINAIKNGWIKEVQIIIWGGSSKVAGSDEEVQKLMKDMMQAGIIVKACRSCAEQYDVVPALEALGIEVKYMGQELTSILERDEKLLTM